MFYLRLPKSERCTSDVPSNGGQRKLSIDSLRSLMGFLPAGGGRGGGGEGNKGTSSGYIAETITRRGSSTSAEEDVNAKETQDTTTETPAATKVAIGNSVKCF